MENCLVVEIIPGSCHELMNAAPGFLLKVFSCPLKPLSDLGHKIQIIISLNLCWALEKFHHQDNMLESHFLFQPQSFSLVCGIDISPH